MTLVRSLALELLHPTSAASEDKQTNKKTATADHIGPGKWTVYLISFIIQNSLSPTILKIKKKSITFDYFPLKSYNALAVFKFLNDI